ncbi:MAG: N-acetyl sugar amidotransferase [Rhodospirillales bacterium]|nr:MAG: N-acetyl sugar amidotransferase [Rhodospirillales bacterium]
MDTSDPDITFDSDGVCNHCRAMEAAMAARAAGAATREADRARLVELMKAEGRGRDYDCVIGVSGGVDSTHVAWLARREFGLRPLAVHFDNGWNDELAVHNIERIVKALDIDLHTHVVDWEEFRDLQLSFFKSHTSNLEMPTDHAILALLMDVAAARGVRFILTGSNTATEGIMPAAWLHSNKDLRFLEAVHARFGSVPLRTYPRLGAAKFARRALLRRIKAIPILDYVEYDKPAAMALAERELGWRPYRFKHGESVFTRFFQCHILPHKFGFDKRKPHFSSLIASGQMTRDAALAALNEPLYRPEALEEETEYVRKKLGMTRAEFDAYMAAPPRSSLEYPNGLALHAAARRVMGSLGGVARRF